MIQNRVALAVAWLMLLPAASCSRTSSESPNGSERAWRIVNASVMTGSQSAKRERVFAAKDALFERLKGRLVEVLGQEGPAQAIEVCKSEAPRLAEEVSREQGLRIGRTSFRLRNAQNQPPDWAKPLVKRQIEEATFLTSGADLVALLPIRLSGECLLCHGPVEMIPEEVKQTLAREYPDDQATGFEEGDLRGWFWVEVPADVGAKGP